MIFPDRVDVWVPRIDGTMPGSGNDRLVWRKIPNVPAQVSPLGSAETINDYQDRVITRYRVILKPLPELESLSPGMVTRLVIGWGPYRAKVAS